MSASEGVSGSSPASASGGTSVLDEEDWQFSEEVRVEGDDELFDDPSSEAEEESVFGVSQDFGAAFDESALSAEASDSAVEGAGQDVPLVARQAAGHAGAASQLALRGVAEGGEPGRDESSFGSVDDFSELMEDDVSPVAAGLASEITSELEEESLRDPAVGSYAETGPTDDLGDPESWDLVGGDDGSRRQATVSGSSRSFARATGIGSVEAEDFFSDDAFAGAAYDEALAGPSVMAGPVGHLLRFLGWGATLALVGGIAFLGLSADWARWAEAPQIVRAGPLEAETKSSGWVETSRAGPILRIAGEIRNLGAEPIWPARVQLALLDASGARLTAAAIRAGAPLPEAVLREAPPAVLEERRAVARDRLAGSLLAPGESRAFEALLPEAELPEAAQRVLLEVGQPVPATRAPDVTPG